MASASLGLLEEGEKEVKRSNAILMQAEAEEEEDGSRRAAIEF